MIVCFVIVSAEIYIIQGSTNHVQRLNVSASGYVTERLQYSPSVPVDSVFAPSANVDSTRKLITLTGGYAKISGVPHFELVWNLNISHSSPSWTPGPNLLKGRYYHCSAKLGTVIYVIAGRDMDNIRLSSVEMWNTSETPANWTQTLEYPHSLLDAACCVMRDEVWVAGGWTSEGVINEVYSWKGPGYTWEAKPSMLKSRRGHSMATDGHQIWVISGFGEASVEMYENDIWHIVSELPGYRELGGSVVWGMHVIQVSGRGPQDGYDGVDIRQTVYLIDRKTGNCSLSPITISDAVMFFAIALITP